MKIKIIKEVYSDKQRKWACAQIDKTADERPDGLSKKEAEEMCTGPMKEEQLEEMSSMAGGSVQGYAGSVVGDKADVEEFNEKEKKASKLKGKKLTEMFSTASIQGGIKIKFSGGHKGHVERSKQQGLRNVVEDSDDTQPTQGDSDKTLGTKWKLSDFADSHRNVNRMMSVLQDIEQNIGLENLRKAVISDTSAPSRIKVMSDKFGYPSDLLEKVKNNDEEGIKKYYQFLINEFLFWVAYNPMSSAQQYAQRGAMLSKPSKDLVYALISQYVSDPIKNNPKAKGQRLAKQADDYKLDKDLDPLLYSLPEE